MHYTCPLCLGIVQPRTIHCQVQPSQHTDSGLCIGRIGRLLVDWTINGRTS